MTFDEFFPGYLEAHADRRTQIIHAAGTITGASIAAAAIVKRDPKLLLAGLAAGYLPAWLSHWAIEHNQPKTFKHPLLSLRADFVMAGKLLTGKLPAA